MKVGMKIEMKSKYNNNKIKIKDKIKYHVNKNKI